MQKKKVKLLMFLKQKNMCGSEDQSQIRLHGQQSISIFYIYCVRFWYSMFQSQPEGLYPAGERCSLIAGCKFYGWRARARVTLMERQVSVSGFVAGGVGRSSGLWGLCLPLSDCINKRGLLSVNLDMCAWECQQCVCVKQYCKRLVSACL